MKKTAIIGKHPIMPCIIQQYKSNDFLVDIFEDEDKTLDIYKYDEIFLLSSPFCTKPTNEDNRILGLLKRLSISGEKTNNKKIVCHLLLQSGKTLDILNKIDFCESITKNINVYPFTTDELWSRKITLDYEPIDVHSVSHVHLVIFGMNDISETISINAAHVAHYPNYIHNHSLRTRITIIDEHISIKYKQLIHKYEHLFNNSYYRLVIPGKDNAVKEVHRPMYEKIREDFVDIEWEFVEASVHDAEIKNKLSFWATDPSQRLSVVFSNEHEVVNIEDSMQLSDIIYSSGIPIYIYMRDDSIYNSIELNKTYSNIRIFGMIDRGYDVTLPHIRMAKIINHIYDQFYMENRPHLNKSDWQAVYAVEINESEMEASWEKLSNVKRQSNIRNALSVETKMRSVGLNSDDWDKFYDISQQDIEMLAEVEHNRWSVEELILGWRPCSIEEQSAIEADISLKKHFKNLKIHYDLRAYKDLRNDETGKSPQIYDLCLCASLPLIAKHYTNK